MESSGNVRKDLVLQQSPSRLDMTRDVELYIEADIHALELEGASDDPEIRRRSELWSLRSYTDDEVIFPHGDGAGDGRWSRCFAGALCEGLGKMGRGASAAS